MNAGKQCIVSSLLPSTQFGDAKFSDARQLHIWLKGQCHSLVIPFVDSYVPWNRPNLFAQYKLHLNSKEIHPLASNMLSTINAVTNVNLDRHRVIALCN